MDSNRSHLMDHNDLVYQLSFLEPFRGRRDELMRHFFQILVLIQLNELVLKHQSHK